MVINTSTYSQYNFTKAAFTGSLLTGTEKFSWQSLLLSTTVINDKAFMKIVHMCLVIIPYSCTQMHLCHMHMETFHNHVIRSLQKVNTHF